MGYVDLRMHVMKPTAGLLSVVAALLYMGCALFGASSPEEPIQVVVDNDLADPVVVRIDARRIGEAKSFGRTSMRTRRVGIEGRAVTVCVHPVGSGRDLCASPLNVPFTVREIWITVQRTGLVSATAL